MPSELVCFEQTCRARYAITEIIYNCPRCGALLEVHLDSSHLDPVALKRTWRERRTSNSALDQSGVWRYGELLPFEEHSQLAVSLREGNTPLLKAPLAAHYGGLDRLVFKHQGFNPTGS